MSKQSTHEWHSTSGVIERRLLVNALVDPGEVEPHLPEGVRPHVTAGGTVVGCCLLAVDNARPTGFPAMFGVGLRAVAHRISVEWDEDTGTVVGVFVPLRHTGSRPAQLVGGRWVPGVHRPARVRFTERGREQRWVVEPREDASRYRMGVTASVMAAEAIEPSEPVGRTCLSATVGLSPGREGALEAVRMEPVHRAAYKVDIARLDSPFLGAFATVRPATSYLMKDVAVTWTPAKAPALAVNGAAT